MALIDHLAAFATPVSVGPNWTVRIDTHFLGGRRQFHSWEVADIGVLVLVRLGGRVRARKVALLQSKRLFPVGAAVVDDTRDDYEIGFGRLLPSNEATAALSRSTRFVFSLDSKYKSLKTGDAQIKAIREFEKLNHILVHYLFYNPWDVPTEVRTPITAFPKLRGSGTVGARLLPSSVVLTQLKGRPAGYSPTLRDLEGLTPGVGSRFGWRLESFVADLVLGCKEGTLLETLAEPSIQNLFSRRSGPISAAIAVSIEGIG